MLRRRGAPRLQRPRSNQLRDQLSSAVMTPVLFIILVLAGVRMTAKIFVSKKVRTRRSEKAVSTNQNTAPAARDLSPVTCRILHIAIGLYTSVYEDPIAINALRWPTTYTLLYFARRFYRDKKLFVYWLSIITASTAISCN